MFLVPLHCTQTSFSASAKHTIRKIVKERQKQQKLHDMKSPFRIICHVPAKYSQVFTSDLRLNEQNSCIFKIRNGFVCFPTPEQGAATTNHRGFNRNSPIESHWLHTLQLYCYLPLIPELRYSACCSSNKILNI